LRKERNNYVIKLRDPKKEVSKIQKKGSYVRFDLILSQAPGFMKKFISGCV